jgi:hypothetical protein
VSKEGADQAKRKININVKMERYWTRKPRAVSKKIQKIAGIMERHGTRKPEAVSKKRADQAKIPEKPKGVKRKEDNGKMENVGRHRGGQRPSHLTGRRR